MPTSLDNVPRGTLTVEPAGPLVSGLLRRVLVIDSHLALVAKDFGRLRRDLPAGVYRVRVESDLVPFETSTLILPDKAALVVYPNSRDDLLNSPAPVAGSISMHEYIRQPLEHIVAAARREQVIIMATRPAEAGGPAVIAFDGFTLTSARTGRRTDLGQAMQPEPNGLNRWTAVAIDVEPGGQTLEWTEPHGGMIYQSLWVPAGWHLLVFVAVDTDTHRPTAERMSIHLSRLGASFAPEHSGQSAPEDTLRRQGALEAAVRSLEDGRMFMPPADLEREFLDAKFVDPLLGIIGAHLLLQRGLKTVPPAVFANLDHLVPHHPDVTALKLMTGVDPGGQLAWPPMLRAGFEAARATDWSDDTIEDGSLCDTMRAKALSGGLWTRWRLTTAEGETSGGRQDTRPPSAVPYDPGARAIGADLGRPLKVTTPFPSTELIAPAISSAPPSPARPAPRVPSPPLMQRIQAFASAHQLLQERPLTPEDLAWTGLNRRQAAVAVTLLTSLRNAASPNRSSGTTPSPLRPPALETGVPDASPVPSTTGSLGELLHLEPINIHQLLRDILIPPGEPAPEGTAVSLAGPLPPILGDKGVLTRVFTDLLGRTRSFAKPAGAPQVEVWAETQDERVRVFVRDKGTGVPPGQIERLLLPISGRPATGRAGGLGFALAQQAIEQMGGRLEVRSEGPAGSTLSLDLRRG